MAKITAVVPDTDTGASSAVKINEAIKNVEVDGTTITGDGIDTPLAATGLQEVVDDTTPQLGGNLDGQDNDIIDVDRLEATTIQTRGGTGTQGEMSWNTDEETIDVIQNGTTLQLGQETQYNVRNNTGVSIPDGTLVYASGTIGASGRITVAPFPNDGTIDASFIIGVATETIANGEDGKVTHFGKVRGIDTSGFSEGDVLYPSITTAGAFQNTLPDAPNVRTPIAFVISSHATTGTIQVRVGNWNDLNADQRVQITTPANGQVLVYNSTTERWENSTPAGGGDVTGPASATNNNFVAFDGTTGKLIKDSGNSAADFATAAQGALADSATQPGDNVSTLVNDAGYIDSDGNSLTNTTVNGVDLDDSGAGGNLYLDDSGNYSSPPSGSGGEANTASNVGSGEGVFKQKTGVDLEFKSIAPGSSKIDITGNTNDVEVDVDETQINALNLTNAPAEAGAEVNPTASEIKTDYESNANTNAFTDAEQTKLSGIETGAEVNPTPSEIKTDYESNANTNAFTDAEQTKLSGIETGAEVNTIDSDTTGEPSGSDQVVNVVSLTQAEYDAGTPVSTTFYIITDAS